MSLYRNIVKLSAPFIKAYHRVESHGEENVPPAGKPAIITPNHSSWLGWDGMIVNSILARRKIRWVGWSYEEEFPLWDRLIEVFEPIWVSKTKPFPFEMVERDILGKGHMVGLFPEGNTNPVGKWYRLRRFLPGAVRLSLSSGAPIIPASIAGLEPASPVIWQNELPDSPATKAIPLPVLLPVKVTVRFGTPIYPDTTMREPYDERKLEELAEELRMKVLELLQKDKPRACAE